MLLRSRLMSNAGKSIKQVITNIDEEVIRPAIERLYFYNMRYGDDPDLKGDVSIVARGASALIIKEQAQMRQNQFLQIALSSPVVQQVVGMEGIAELLRQSAKTLDLNPDRVVPPVEILKQRMAQQQAMQQQAMQQQAMLAQAGGQAPSPQEGATLATGQPVTNNFQALPGVGS